MSRIGAGTTGPLSASAWLLDVVRLAPVLATVLAALPGAAIAQSPGGWGVPLAAPAPAAAPDQVADSPALPPLPQLATEVPGEFEVVPLRYADVSEIVGLLTSAAAIKPNDTFAPQEPAFGAGGLQGATPGGGYGGGYTGGGFAGGGIATPTFAAPAAQSGGASDALGQTIDESIGVDRRLNAVVLKGTPAHVAELKARIAKLDVPVASVLLEIEFVELTETGARNLGFDFTNGSGQVAVASYGFGAASSTFGSGTSGSAGGLAVAMQAAIAAQITKGDGRILSRPRIAAQTGSTARIVTGDALPILTSIALSGVNAVQQQVQYVNVGVTLQIAPRLTDDGFVTSHIFAEVSSVTGYSQGYPTISQREAETSATVKLGESFVIGGLTQESRLSQKKKVPLLGDVPLLGTLFHSENSSRAKTELYIVVTPRAVRGAPTAPPPGPALARQPG